MRPIFIDEDVNILFGPEAQQQLTKRNDRRYLDQEGGVLVVPQERWASAQRAERAHWMRLGIRAQDDRNRQHFEGFRRFAVLRGRRFEHALEIGCGPFTNLRIIGRACKIDRCTLLDPLILSYLSHPYCYYDENLLDLEPSGLPGRVARKLFPRFFRAIQRALGRCIPVASLEPTPIESYGVAGPFDMVIMINVLEHCFDGRRVFERALGACRPGSVFVFLDRLYDARPLSDELALRFDAAHPLKIDRKIVTDFLAGNFDDMFVDVLPRTTRCLPEEAAARWDEIFFIGTRKAA